MNGSVKRPINHLKITLMEKEQVFTAFEEMLSGESGEQPFKNASLYDVPYVFLNSVRSISRQLRNFEALYAEAPSDEIQKCIGNLKSVVNEVPPLAAKMIQDNEKISLHKSVMATSDEFDKLLKECGEKWDEANEKGSEKLRDADSFIDRAEAVIDYSGDLYDAAKWCSGELFDKIRGRKGEE